MGFLGIARNMENILDAFATVEQRRREVADDLDDCLRAATSVGGSAPLERTVTRLTMVAGQLERASSATSSAAEQAAATVRTVGAVLAGGKPEPLQSRAGGIGDALGIVAGQLSTTRTTVQRSILSALQAGTADDAGTGLQHRCASSDPAAGAHGRQPVPASSVDALRARVMGNGQGESLDDRRLGGGAGVGAATAQEARRSTSTTTASDVSPSSAGVPERRASKRGGPAHRPVRESD